MIDQGEMTELSIAELFEELIERFDEIDQRLTNIEESQAEIIEKIDNLSLPGVDYSVYTES